MDVNQHCQSILGSAGSFACTGGLIRSNRDCSDLDYPDLLLWSHLFMNICNYCLAIKRNIIFTNFKIPLMFFWYLLLICNSSLNTVFPYVCSWNVHSLVTRHWIVWLINIHIFDYLYSRLSGLFRPVTESPDNRGLTVQLNCLDIYKFSQLVLSTEKISRENLYFGYGTQRVNSLVSSSKAHNSPRIIITILHHKCRNHFVPS